MFEDLEGKDLRTHVRTYIYDIHNGIVQTGPFQGMKLLRKGDNNLGSKTLGCYEAELHGPIEREIARLQTIEHPLIINLGSAQGYYAIGLAMRLPDATVYGVDIKPERFRFLHMAAELNGVRVITVPAHEFTLSACDLILSDCEGAEVDYLDPKRFPFLATTPMIVETHDGTHKILIERFKATHRFWSALSEQSREPNQYPCLLALHSHAKWIAISENRPKTAPYLYLVPKG